MSNYRHELIDAKHSEGIYGFLLALAFVTFAFTNEWPWVAVDVILAGLFVAFGVKDLCRARQIKREAA